MKLTVNSPPGLPEPGLSPDLRVRSTPAVDSALVGRASGRRRNAWPLAIIVIFVIFFGGLVSFVVFATRQPIDLVRPDYYEEEMRYQQQLDRVNRTRQNGQTIAIAYDQLQQQIVVRLPLEPSGQIFGKIHLYRPSDARLDQKLELSLDPQGTQTFDAKKLRAGLWKVRVQWTAAGKEYYSDKTIILPAGA